MKSDIETGKVIGNWWITSFVVFVSLVLLSQLIGVSIGFGVMVALLAVAGWIYTELVSMKA